ncbi:MAG: phosphoribosylglycinamide formyltransferase [Phycisphaerae bacterium]|nr:phosphoribosylglycinamide formyltransferase [Phycisphaerae bacterium]
MRESKPESGADRSGTDGAGSSGGSPVPALCVLLSGGGRTLVNLCERIERGELRARVGLVVGSRACAGLERARERGLSARVAPGDLSAAAIEAMAAEFGVSWVVLAGYLRLVRIPESLRGRIVNIHPALLPSFGGRGMYGHHVHEAVLAAGCKVSGCTVHLCDDRFDTGPILAQAACEVRDEDTAASLAARVFALECELYPRALADLIAGRYVFDGRRTRRIGA